MSRPSVPIDIRGGASGRVSRGDPRVARLAELRARMLELQHVLADLAALGRRAEESLATARREYREAEMCLFGRLRPETESPPVAEAVVDA